MTVVYAGPLTAPGNDREATRKGLEELTGVYLQQRAVNKTVRRSVKLRVLTANGGAGMLRQLTAVRKIIEVARRDPTVVGVVGLGRNTEQSDDAVELLREAGLPLVDTTNSSSDLPRDFPNYFGLAATDEEQTYALGLVARQIADDLDRPHAIVLSRKKRNGDLDQYTTEQRAAGGKMLREAGFSLGEGVEYNLAGGASLNAPLATICGAERVPDALYFAGRVEDVPALMRGLSEATGCADRRMTVFTGDDLTKGTFDDSTSIAANVTLYHSSLAPLDRGKNLGFYGDSYRALRRLHPRRGGRDPGVGAVGVRGRPVRQRADRDRLQRDGGPVRRGGAPGRAAERRGDLGDAAHGGAEQHAHGDDLVQPGAVLGLGQPARPQHRQGRPAGARRPADPGVRQVAGAAPPLTAKDCRP